MIKVYVMDYGYIRLDSMIIKGRVNMMTTKPGAKTEHEWMETPVWGLLIDTGDHRIMYDLGCLENAMDEGVWPDFARYGTPWYHTPEQTIPAQLAKLGLKPEDVDTVIVSHTHVDHFGGIGYFRHANVYVPEEDWVHALVTMHRTSDTSQYDQALPIEFDVRVKEFIPIKKGEDFEVFPGIQIITLPGHTLNLLGLIVDLQNSGKMIFTSDALYLADQLRLPVKQSGSVRDSMGYNASIKKLVNLRDRLGATVVPGHDMEVFNQLKKIPEYYD